jgi:hypothetical protein
MHDGSHLTLRKLEQDYDPTDQSQAIHTIRESKVKGEFLTGLFYIDPHQSTFIDNLHLHDEPLATLSPDRMRPSRETLRTIMESFK